MAVQFKVDENLPVEALEALRVAGHDAVSAVDQGLGGAEDAQVSHIAWQEGRVLLTLDLDFADIRAYPPEEYPGIVVLRLARQDKNSILSVLSRLVEPLSRLPVKGQLWIVEEHRVRTRGRAADTPERPSSGD